MPRITPADPLYDPDNPFATRAGRSILSHPHSTRIQQLLLQGHSIRAVARQFHLHEKTVRAYRQNFIAPAIIAAGKGKQQFLGVTALDAVGAHVRHIGRSAEPLAEGRATKQQIAAHKALSESGRNVTDLYRLLAEINREIEAPGSGLPQGVGGPVAILNLIALPHGRGVEAGRTPEIEARAATIVHGEPPAKREPEEPWESPQRRKWTPEKRAALAATWTPERKAELSRKMRERWERVQAEREAAMAKAVKGQGRDRERGRVKQLPSGKQKRRQ